MISENSRHYPGWQVALASAFCVFVSFASLLVYTFGVFLKPLAAEFHWSRETISAAFGIAALSVAACSPFIGMLLDRFPARRIFLPCLTIFGCAFASLSLLTAHLWHLYAVFLVLGIVGNGTAQLAYSRAVSTWFQHRRGAAFAMLMSGGAVGAMVLPVLAQFLINRLGWRMAFVALGAMVLCIGLPAGLRIRERVAPVLDSELPVEGATVAEALRSYIYWIVLAVLFLVSVGQNASIAHMAALLTDRGITPATAALALSVLGGATLAGRLLTGWLLDRYSGPRVSFCLIGLGALGTLLLSSAHSAPLGFLAAALIGLGMGGEADVTPYLLSKYFGLRCFSVLYGLSWTAYAIAGAIGPVIMGKAFDSSGSYQSLLFRLALVTVAGASLMLVLPAYATGRPPGDLVSVEVSVAS